MLAAPSPTVQRVLTSVLGRAGHEVVGVADGVAAAHAALAGEADCLVAFADLPRLSGFALTRLLREQVRTAHLPVILLTAAGAAAERHWATRCGADRALPTDVESKDLVAAVAAEMAADRPPTAAPDDPVLADDAVLSRTVEVLEWALFETSLVAEVTELASAGLDAEGAVAGLLGAVARALDPALVVVLTPDPPLALVLVGQPVSRSHYRDLLLRVAADVGAATGAVLDAGSLDARAADADALLGADDGAHLVGYHALPLTAADGRYVGHLAVSASAGDLPPRATRTLALLARPAGLLVATVEGRLGR